MQMVYCTNCGSVSGFKRAWGFVRSFRTGWQFKPCFGLSGSVRRVSRRWADLGTTSILAPPLALTLLLRLYEKRVRSHMSDPHRFDPLLALCGSGRRLWADQHADEYINHLRECWE